MKTLILVTTALLLVACQPRESVLESGAQLIVLDEHGLTCIYINVGIYQGGLTCDWSAYRDKHEPQAQLEPQSNMSCINNPGLCAPPQQLWSPPAAPAWHPPLVSNVLPYYCKRDHVGPRTHDQAKDCQRLLVEEMLE